MSVLTSVLALSLVACSSSSNTEQTETGVKDGEYTASAEGFGNGEVKVTITVKEGKIASAEVDGSTQSEGYGKTAADGLAQEIVDGQTYDIDVVSGATATRDAVSLAAKDCMTQAGFEVDSLTTIVETGRSRNRCISNWYGCFWFCSRIKSK